MRAAASVSGSSDDGSIEEALRLLEAEVTRMAPSGTQRRLASLLGVYLHVVGRWPEQPPSAPQRAFMRRLVADLRSELRSEAPTIRLPRPT
jgi:hypothetical protein